MGQTMIDIQPEYSIWIITNKGDTSCCELADRHYTRQSVGNKQFCRPGRNLVLRTPIGDAVWVTWRGIRDDGYDAWECTLFRNESAILSSEMIREAVNITIRKWGELPKDGLITYVNQAKVRSINPGCCFLKAGFRKIKQDRLILLQYKGGGTDE